MLTNFEYYLIAIRMLNFAFYTFIWLNPTKFIGISKKLGYVPYKLMYHVAFAFYFLSFIPLGIYYLVPNIVQIFYTALSIYGIMSVMVMLVGQFLNSHIYNKIGLAGVYYGTRLGENIPWVHDIIFDTIKHPQYIGCIMTLVGVSALVNSYNCYVVCGSYILGYLYMAYLEDNY